MMDAERTVRLTVAGWALLMAWFGQRWLLGLESDLSLFGQTQNWAGPLAAAFAASPVLGLFVTSVAHGVLRACRGGEAQFDVPTEHDNRVEFVRGLIARMPEQSAKIWGFAGAEKVGEEFTLPAVGTGFRERWRTREKDDKLKPFVDVVYHSQAPAHLISYTARRWTLYWMHLNVITALVVGSILPAWHAVTAYRNSQVKSSPQHIVLEAVLISFVVYSAVRLRELRRDVSEVVRIWLASPSERQSAPMLPSPPPTPNQ